MSKSSSLTVADILALISEEAPEFYRKHQATLDSVTANPDGKTWTNSNGVVGDFADLLAAAGFGSKPECEALLYGETSPIVSPGSGLSDDPTEATPVGSSPLMELPPTSLAEKLGITGVIALLEARHPEEYAEAADFLSKLEPYEDAEWRTSRHNGDAIDLFARVTKKSRAEAKRELGGLLSQLSPEEQTPFFRQVPAPTLDASLPFPLAALPEKIRRLALEISLVHGVDVSLPATVALAAVSTSLGKALKLTSVRGLWVSGNIYVVAGCAPSVGKSVVSKYLTEPLHAYQDSIREKHKLSLPQIQAALKEANKRLTEEMAKTEDGSRPNTGDDQGSARQSIETLQANIIKLERSLVPPRFLVEDVTAPKLVMLLEEQSEFLASISADAKSAIMNLLGRHSNGNADDDLFLKGFSGDRFNQDRVSRPEVILRSPKLVVCWLTQAKPFSEVWKSPDLRECGFLCRCLCLQASATRRSLEEISPQAIADYENLINSLLSTYVFHAGAAHAVSREPDVEGVLSEFEQRVESWKQDEDLEEFQSFPGRWNEIAWNLALVLHAAEYGASAHRLPLSGETAKNATALMTWFAAQQKDLLVQCLATSKNTKLDAALDYVNRSPVGVTARDLFRSKESLFSNSRDASLTLEVLVKEGRITSSPGRKSTVFERKRIPR